MQQQLSSVELANLRHIILEEQVALNKADFFAQQVSDAKFKSLLEKKARRCKENVQQLNQFITTY